MSQSLSQIYVHIIFHVNHQNQITLRSSDSPKLYAFIGYLLKQKKCTPIQINGMHDHIHILCVLSKNIALSKLLQHIKSISSQWLKSTDPYYSEFAWQKGYGAFSVSPSLYQKTWNYIINQSEHHKKRSVQDEYILFLKEYNIDYDECFLLKD